MPLYRIRMTNSDFESVDEAEYRSLDAALKSAITTATKIAGESIGDGVPSSAVEVQVSKDDVVLARKVITLSVSNLTAVEQRD